MFSLHSVFNISDSLEITLREEGDTWARNRVCWFIFPSIVSYSQDSSSCWNTNQNVCLIALKRCMDLIQYRLLGKPQVYNIFMWLNRHLYVTVIFIIFMCPQGQFFFFLKVWGTGTRVSFTTICSLNNSLYFLHVEFINIASNNLE